MLQSFEVAISWRQAAASRVKFGDHLRCQLRVIFENIERLLLACGFQSLLKRVADIHPEEKCVHATPIFSRALPKDESDVEMIRILSILTRSQALCGECTAA